MLMVNIRLQTLIRRGTYPNFTIQTGTSQAVGRSSSVRHSDPDFFSSFLSRGIMNKMRNNGRCVGQHEGAILEYCVESPQVTLKLSSR